MLHTTVGCSLRMYSEAPKASDEEANELNMFEFSCYAINDVSLGNGAEFFSGCHRKEKKDDASKACTDSS